MATFFVDSGASGANDGTSKTDAWVLIESAESVAGGSEVHASHTHAESTAGSMTLSFSNSALNNPVIIKSVDFSDDSYTPGASVTRTGVGNDILIAPTGTRYFGISFNSPDNFTLGNNSNVGYFEDCTFITTDLFIIGANETFLKFTNCTFTTSNGVTPFGFSAETVSEFYDCTFNHSFATDMTPSIAANTRLLFQGCSFPDTSADFAAANVGLGSAEAIFRDCLIVSGFTPFGGSIVQEPSRVAVENCSSSTSLALPLVGGVVDIYTYAGVVSDVLTPDRTGGADDGFNGLYSRKMVTNANAVKKYVALNSGDLTKRLATNSSPSGATAQSIYTSTRPGPQDSATALTADSSTWNGSGATTEYKVTHTLNSEDGATLTVYIWGPSGLTDEDFWLEINEPDQVGGTLRVNVFLAKPSITIYLDVKLEVV